MDSELKEALLDVVEGESYKAVLDLMNRLTDTICEAMLSIPPTPENKDVIYLAAAEAAGAKKLTRRFKETMQALKKKSE